MTGILRVDNISSTTAVSGNAITLDSSNNVTFPVSVTATTVANADGTLRPLVTGTVVASTSGTSIDFTGIPSWAERITVLFQSVSTSGTSVIIIQLGTSAGFVTSGYLGAASAFTTTNASANFTTGIAPSNHNVATDVRHGHVSIVSLTGSVWCANSVIALSSTTGVGTGAGSVSLPGTLDRVRITTVAGTDTFDSGNINIFWE